MVQADDALACRNISFLRLLASSNRKRRKQLIQIASTGEIVAVCECIDNLLLGNIPLSLKNKEYFKKHKKHLRYLIQQKVPSSKKREVLQQRGGFLSFLLPLALSILTKILGAK